MNAILPPSLLAIVSYYTTLYAAPTLQVSLLVIAYEHPRLLAFYKLLKCLIRLLARKGTELQRVLNRASRQDSSEGRVRLREEEDADDDGSSEDETWPGKDDERLDRWTLWRIDCSLSSSSKLSSQHLALRDAQLSEKDLSDLASSIVASKLLQESVEVHELLCDVLKRLNALHVYAGDIIARTQDKVDKDDKLYRGKLDKLWKLYFPSTPLDASMLTNTKQWQDMGFQGKDPSTDWRSVGPLGLDCLLYFGEHYGDRARSLLGQAVKGVDGEGRGWYPFAIVSITLTDFLLSVLRTFPSFLFLFPASMTSAASLQPFAKFSEIHSLLLLHFHAHWQHLQTSEHSQEANKSRPTVMEFESVMKAYKTEVKKWLKRGRVAGWTDSRGLVEVTANGAITQNVSMHGQLEGSGDETSGPKGQKSPSEEEPLVDL